MFIVISTGNGFKKIQTYIYYFKSEASDIISMYV